MSRPRIAIAGFQHETNSFAPFLAGMPEFLMADSWPPLLQGQDVLSHTSGMNLPIAGAATHAGQQDVDIVPLLWASAEPSGFVTDDAFDRISAMILDGIAAAGPLDGIYLDLHGAMVTQGFDDGEAALLDRIRKQVGPDLPIVISLDLHANISRQLVDLCDAITIYRTYPHLDMASTGARAMERLLRILGGASYECAFRQVPFLVPLNAQHTGSAPCQKLYGMLDQLVTGDHEYADLAMGFTAADIADCGPSIVAYAPDQDRATAIADQIFREFCARESEFDTYLYAPKDAIAKASSVPGTVTLADVQDNAGAGGGSDSTGLLAALIETRATNTICGVFFDPELAAAAHAKGVGAKFHSQIGGVLSHHVSKPINCEFEVVGLSDGKIAYTGEMYGGGIAEIGPSCLLRICAPGCDIQIVVSSVRAQCLDLAFFTHFGVDPSAAKLVCVKSTVHFRADFEPISSLVLNVSTPGLFPCDLNAVSYAKCTKPACNGT